MKRDKTPYGFRQEYEVKEKDRSATKKKTAKGAAKRKAAKKNKRK
ncbi:hypothetical protein [Enterococcus sp. DIV1420a]